MTSETGCVPSSGGGDGYKFRIASRFRRVKFVIENYGAKLPGGIEFVVRSRAFTTHVTREAAPNTFGRGGDADTLGWLWADGQLVFLALGGGGRRGRRVIKYGTQTLVSGGPSWSTMSLWKTVWRTEGLPKQPGFVVRVGIRKFRVEAAARVVAVGTAWPFTNRRKIVVRPRCAGLAPVIVAMAIAEWRIGLRQ